MGNKMRLLDCTLRDGGYINDWAFGRENISYLFERLVSSGVDVIEIGFLDQRRQYDPDRTILPDTKSVEKTFGKLNRGNAMVVGMIDYGTCGIENLQSCKESWLDGIRVIFKKEIMQEAIAFCTQVKALGYQVFVQAVSITSYNDDELRELVGLVNEFHPFAMSMVDTYGLIEPSSLTHICKVIDSVLDPGICLGFHAHNNFQLGYANAMAMLSMGLERDVLVDGTLYGMGKSAGNAPGELIAMHMNTNYGKHYNVDQMQEAIATCVLDMYRKQPWGYTLFYYIAAANKCHPNYVSYLMNKRTLSVTAINEILQQIPEEKKLGKDTKMIEKMYLDYQKNECNDEETIDALKLRIQRRSVLMLGPGCSAVNQAYKIAEYIEKEAPIVLSVNHIPRNIRPDYLFVTNSKRYLQMSEGLLQDTSKDIPVIATSNVTRTGGKFPFVVNYSSLLNNNAEFKDNSMIMLLKLLKKLEIAHVALAGFDGYTPDNLNYFDTNMEYSFIKEKADVLNHDAKCFLEQYSQETELRFVTPSRYQE